MGGMTFVLPTQPLHHLLKHDGHEGRDGGVEPLEALEVQEGAAVGSRGR
jgi:hypothetical protein